MIRLLSLISLVIALTDGTLAQDVKLDLKPYMKLLAVERNESGVQQQLRELKTLPYRDRAYRLAEAGNKPAAVAELKKFLRVDPKHLGVRYELMLLLYQIDRYPEAIAEADAILGERPQFTPASLYRAFSLQKSQQPAAALDSYWKLSQSSSAEKTLKIYALSQYVDLATSEGETKRTIQGLRALQSIGEPAFEGQRRITMLLIAEGSADEAMKAAISAAAIAPSRTERERLWLEASRAAADSGRSEVARAFLEKALATDATNDNLTRELARLELDLGNNLRAAELFSRIEKPTAEDRQVLGTLLEKTATDTASVPRLREMLSGTTDPVEQAQLLHAIGRAHAANGEHRKAIDSFRESLRRNRTTQTLADLADSLRRAGRSAEAGGAYEELYLRSRDPLHAHLAGQAYEKANAGDQAIQYYTIAARDLASREARAQAYAQLGYLQLARDRLDEARAAFEKAAALSRNLSQTMTEAIADLEIRQSNFSSAADAFLRQLERQPNLELLLRTAETLILAERHEEAARVLDRVVGFPGVDRDTAAHASAQAGYVRAALHMRSEALINFRNAVAFGIQDPTIHQSMALLLFDLDRGEEALVECREAERLAQSAETTLFLARCHEKVGESRQAIPHYERLLPDITTLPAVDQVSVFNALGYHYFAVSDFARAAEMFARSVSLQKQPSVEISLGMSLRRHGNLDEAELTLEGIDVGSLDPTERALLLDELAQTILEQDRTQEAASLLAQAIQIETSADRHYRLGILYRRLGRETEAVEQLELATDIEPNQPLYRIEYGYALAEEGLTKPATVQLSTAAEQDPDNLQLMKDLGYLYAKDGSRHSAVTWFKKAIDAETELQASEEPSVSLQSDLYDLRRAVADLESPLNFIAYAAVRSEDFPTFAVGGGIAGGVLSSQSGLELSFRPDWLTLGDGRELQIFGRILGSLEPESVQPVDETYQGGVGIRFKPLRSQIFYLSAERLFEIGELSQDNWLLRSQYMWAHGLGLRPTEQAWNNFQIYLDVGYFVEEPATWAYYGEVREGISIRVGNSFALTPHLMAALRYQDPLEDRSAYGEVGGGLSFRFFASDRYRAEFASVELLLQYRKGDFLDEDLGRLHRDFDGPIATFVLQY